MNKSKRLLQILLVIVYLAFWNQGVFANDTERSLFTGNVTKAKLKKSLISKNDFNPFPGFVDRNAWQSLPSNLKEEIKSSAEDMLDYEWPWLSASLTLEFVRTGNRTHYEKYWFEKRRNLWTLAIAEMIEGKGRFMEQIMNGIWNICDESYWGFPAHIPGLPNVEDPYVDLFAAETGSMLSWTYYFFKDELDEISPLISKRIYHEVNRRVLTPALNVDHYWMGFGKGGRPNNWNPWICSNWLTAVLILEPDQDRRAESVYRICEVLDQYTNPYPADGGCDEGPLYWNIAAASLFDNIELLNVSTNGAFNLYSNPLIKNMGSYLYKVYIGNHYIVNFADASPRVIGNGGIVYRYGKKIDDETMMEFGSFLMQEQERNFPLLGGLVCWRTLSDLFQYEEVKEFPAEEPLIKESWFPEINVMTARSNEGSLKGFYIAAKGGHNGESHNHNDIGNFIVYYDGEPIFIDIGGGTYTRRTFGPDRYTLWFNQSAYHNVPTINGKKQSPGREFKAKYVNFKSKPFYAQISMDISGAYPEKANIQSWNRTIRLNRNRNITLKDVYQLKSEGEQIVQNIMTIYPIKIIKPGLLELKIEQTKAIKLSYDPDQFEAKIEQIELGLPEDEGVIQKWGDKIYRIQLINNKPGSKGDFTFKVFD